MLRFLSILSFSYRKYTTSKAPVRTNRKAASRVNTPAACFPRNARYFSSLIGLTSFGGFGGVNEELEVSTGSWSDIGFIVAEEEGGEEVDEDVGKVCWSVGFPLTDNEGSGDGDFVVLGWIDEDFCSDNIESLEVGLVKLVWDLPFEVTFLILFDFRLDTEVCSRAIGVLLRSIDCCRRYKTAKVSVILLN